jgi:hypothetical protein
MFLPHATNTRIILKVKLYIEYCRSRDHSIEREIDELVGGYQIIHAVNIRHCLVFQKRQGYMIQTSTETIRSIQENDGLCFKVIVLAGNKHGQIMFISGHNL